MKQRYKILIVNMTMCLCISSFTGCYTYFLQNTSVLVNRKVPSITIADGDRNLVQFAWNKP